MRIALSIIIFLGGACILASLDNWTSESWSDIAIGVVAIGLGALLLTLLE